MEKEKLNYRFHNPNSTAATADYILKIFIEANMKKVKKAIQEAVKTSEATNSSACHRHPI